MRNRAGQLVPPTPADPEGEDHAILDLLLDLARERTPETILELIVGSLAARPEVALARIWLLGDADICDRCPKAEFCPLPRERCLHLVASDGSSRVRPSERWTGTGGYFQRFPLGHKKVGEIALTREPRAVPADDDWITRPDWARAEGVESFSGVPLLFGDEVLGVLAVFLRRAAILEGAVGLRLLADHAATAIVNARAFGQIEELKRHVELENACLREEVTGSGAFGEIIGHSAAIRNLVEQIELVAPTDASVLILGESGSGKELVARELHRRGTRRDGPLIKVNCAAIPAELFESEFFGHARGAFTGAVAERAGRFEAAHRGTLLLDEVGEIPLRLQGKLLRVLQEGQFERVGEERTRNCDVRIVAATHRDLQEEVDAGRFRQDLYYRLNVFPIEVAPLRRRLEDVPLLAERFVERTARRLRRPLPRLTEADKLALMSYDWPGNVRELQNVLERALIVSPPGTLQLALPARAGSSPGGTGGADRERRTAETDAVRTRDSISTEHELRELIRDNTRRALEAAGGRIRGPGGAAELLGMPPTTLSSRIARLGIRRS